MSGRDLAPELGLYGLVDRLLPNCLQFLVLLRRKNRPHLRIGLLMNSSELLYFLNFRERIIALDCLHFWSFGDENR